MRTKPIPYDDYDRVANAPARPVGAPANLAGRIGRQLLHETVDAVRSGSLGGNEGTELNRSGLTGMRGGR